MLASLTNFVRPVEEHSRISRILIVLYTVPRGHQVRHHGQLKIWDSSRLA